MHNFTIMQKIDNTTNAAAGQSITKAKKHLRLKIDLGTWHLIPFSEQMNLPPATKVTGKQFGFLCFVFIFTKAV